MKRKVIRRKRPAKRVFIHTYIHTTMNDMESSLMPRETTFMFILKDGVWQLAHTFPCTQDKIVRGFARAYSKQMKDVVAAIRIEKHIFGKASI